MPYAYAMTARQVLAIPYHAHELSVLRRERHEPVESSANNLELTVVPR